MDDIILRRLEVLERESFATRVALSRLAQGPTKGRRAPQEPDGGDLVARLSPGPLAGPMGYRRGRPERLPDLGAPLLARLRDDASMGTLTSGRTDPTGGTGNLLPDPTLEDLPQVATAVGTVAHVLVPACWQWRGWYVLNSGTAPTTPTVKRVAKRISPGQSYGSSAVARLDLGFGAAAGDATLYLESVPGDVLRLAPPWDYLLAHGRVWPGTITGSAQITSATVRVEVVELVSGVYTVVADSEPVDLLTVAPDIQSLTHAAFEGPVADLFTSYYWRLRFDVVKTAGATAAVQVLLAEPDLHVSRDASPAMFTPAVGVWAPESLLHYGHDTSPAGTDVIAIWSDGAEVLTVREDGDVVFHDQGAGSDMTLGWVSDDQVALSGGLRIGKQLHLQGIIRPALSGAAQNDYNPTGWTDAAVMLADSSGATTITGLAGGAEGRVAIIVNIEATVGAADITLAHNSASSSAANRILCPLNADLVLGARQAAVLIYDGTTSFWRVVSGGGGSAPGAVSFSGARYYRATNQSIATATDSNLRFNVGTATGTQDYDVGSWHSDANDERFTAPTACKVHVDAGVEWEANATGVRNLWIEVNGVATDKARARDDDPSGSDNVFLDVSLDLDLAAGDYVVARVRQSSGAALNVIAGEASYLNIHLLGGVQGDAGPAGAGLTLTTVEKNLGSIARRSGEFDITGLTGLTAGKQVLIAQQAGPYTGKGTLPDEAEMDQVTITGYVVDATTIRCYWVSPTRLKGNVKFGYQVSA